MVIILIAIGVLLILLNVKAIKKEDNSFSAILKREETVTNRDYDVEIISIRKDLAETVLDLQKEMEEIKESIKNMKIEKNKINYIENIEEKEKDYDIINKDIKDETNTKEIGVVSEINFNNKAPKVKKVENLNKVDQVKNLVLEGLTDEEIASKMSIGKGGSTINKRIIQKLKNIVDFLCDRKILMGIGIGMIIASVMMFGYKYNGSISDDKIEEKARGFGMHYDDECKVLFKGENKDD